MKLNNLKYWPVLVLSLTTLASEPVWVKDGVKYVVDGEILLKRQDGSTINASLNQSMPSRTSVSGRTPNIMVVSNDSQDIAEKADFAFLTDGGSKVAFFVNGLLVAIDKSEFEARYTYESYSASNLTEYAYNNHAESYTRIYNMVYRIGNRNGSLSNEAYFYYAALSYLADAPMGCGIGDGFAGCGIPWDYESGRISASSSSQRYIEVPKTFHGQISAGTTFKFVFKDYFQAKVSTAYPGAFHEEVIAECEQELWGPDGRISLDIYKDHVYRNKGFFYPTQNLYSHEYQSESWDGGASFPDIRLLNDQIDHVPGCNRGNSGYFKTGNGSYYIVNSVQSRPVKDSWQGYTGKPRSSNIPGHSIPKGYGNFSNRGMLTTSYSVVSRKYLYINGELSIIPEGPEPYLHTFKISDNPKRPLIALTNDPDLGSGDVLYILDTENKKWLNAGYLDYGFDGVWYENMKVK